MVGCSAGFASGPRFVTGPPFFTGQAGVAIGWRQTNLMYYTDPGDLSASVNHAAADALVAAAAGVWNVPVASITVGKGGSLAEHVSGQNVYLDSTGMNYPADVGSGNAAAIPIAVIYDADGSVTDTLLGAGASGPSQCRGNSVTESVDSFDPAGYILHAIIVLNGRCTGAAAGQQLEMQYKLQRIFGRVLGLAWTQTNDNVFTGTPQPTYNQALHWPVMHPLEIICGPYSYQCMPNPFQLRADDIAGLVAVYPIARNAATTQGKQASLTYGSNGQGSVSFQSGQGMAGVNVLVTREPPYSAPEGWAEVSAVSGTYFRRAGRSLFVAADPSPLGSQGALNQGFVGQFVVAYTPIDESLNFQTLVFSTEPVNALYTGAYSLGPYAAGNVMPSGSPQAQNSDVDQQFGYASVSWTVANAAAACGDGTDGTPSAPNPVAASGWWNGVLCAYGHNSYSSVTMQAGRTYTMEVTALDEGGLATEAKAMPVMGLFAPTDGPGALPSAGVTAAAFNGRGVGTTTVGGQTGAAGGAPMVMRLGIADQRNDGRPDFGYQARLFYADSVAPAQVPVGGGTMTISGYGFRMGNAVAINGVAAAVVSATANTLVVTAPAMAAVRGVQGTAVDIAVSDVSTGATSVMSAALTYSNAPASAMTMKLVSAPAGTQYVGDAAGVAFAVQVIGADGTTPAAGVGVTFSTVAGTVRWAACGGAATCRVVTDANGMASSGVTPGSAGGVTIQAADGSLVQTASFTAVAQAGSIAVLSGPSGNLPVGMQALTAFTVRVLDGNGNGMPGRAVTFSVGSGGGSATFSGCSTQVCTVTTDGSGAALVNVTPTAVGPVTLLATNGDARGSVQFTAVSNGDTMQITQAPTTGTVYPGTLTAAFQIRLLRYDGSPDYGQQVVFTAPSGITILQCASGVCPQMTQGSGLAAVQLETSAVGTFTIQAAFGAVTQSVSVTVVDHTLQLRLVSAPSGNVPVGTRASVPLSAQVLMDGVTPQANAEVGLSGPNDAVVLNSCLGISVCRLTTDGNGMVSTTVTPTKAGTITLSVALAPVVLTASFTATGPVETMQVLTQPGANGVLVGDAVTLAIQLIGSDGTTVYPNQLVSVTVRSGSFGLTGCGYGSCVYRTDANGKLSLVGVAAGAGAISVVIADALNSQTISFTANSKPDVMQVVSAPASGGNAGVEAGTAFAVKVMYGDGITLAAGRNVAVSVTQGAAGFKACGGLGSCTLVTDASGMISTAVTPLSGGAITLSATEGGVTQTATFTAVAQAESIAIVSVPADGSVVGNAAAAAFAVRVVGADGVTGLPGHHVTLSVTNGSARLGVCGAASCVVVTDGAGVAQSAVTPLAPGTVGLLAAEGAVMRATSFNAVAQASQRTLTMATGPVHVAEGAAMHLNLVAVAAENGGASAGQPVHWTGSQGVTLGAVDSTTAADGSSTMPVVLGPLAGGAGATATACAWNGVCAPFTGTGVAADSLQITLTAGAGQSVSGGAALGSVRANVTDGMGNAVAGASVSVYQMVTAMDASCTDRGRCATAPVVLSKTTVVVSDGDGNVTVAPLTGTGLPAQTEMVFSVGTKGSVSTVLTQSP